MNIQEVRQKFPQYNDLSDQRLADALHAKFYPDMDKGEYYQKIGFSIQEPAPEKPPISERIGGYFKEMAGNVPGNVADIAKSIGGIIADPMGTATGISDIISGGQAALLREIAGSLVPHTDAEEKFNAVLRDISAPIQESIESPAGVPGRVAEFAKERPVDFALAVIPFGVKGRSALKTTPAKIDKKITGAVTSGMEKGVRPSVVNAKTAPQATRYFQNAREAVETIILNKNNLKLTDEFGDAASGLPTNLKQFSQAIDQAKGQIYNEYSAMAAKAGGKGAEVNLTPIAQELLDLTKSNALRDNAGHVVEYALDRLAKYASRGKYTAQEAQEAIQILNNSLDAFYKNPTYDTASRAYVDSLIANNLRKSLDKAIEGIEGAGYADLKKAYGSLKSIERDVNRRSIVDSRKNAKGLIDYTDVYTHTTAIHGILSLNPAIIGAAAAGKGTKALYRHLIDPNRIVKNMFTETEKLMKKKGMIAP